MDRCDGLAREEDDPAHDKSRADRLVARLFAGPREALLPTYRAILKVARGLGPEVHVCPANTIVPFYRRHVFAQVKPTTRTRIDLGLALKGDPFGPRLLDTGGTARHDRITHRIPLAAPDDVDAEVARALAAAYERGA